MGMGPHILGHTSDDIEFAFEKAEEAIATL